MRWLEARLVEDIRSAKMVQVMNGNEPGGGKLPEADEADMAIFMENVRILMPVLGLNVFASVTGNPVEDAEVGGVRLRLTWDTAEANCIAKDGAFIIQKGLTARKRNVDSLQPSYKSMRNRLIESGVWEPHGTEPGSSHKTTYLTRPVPPQLPSPGPASTVGRRGRSRPRVRPTRNGRRRG